MPEKNLLYKKNLKYDTTYMYSLLFLSLIYGPKISRSRR